MKELLMVPFNNAVLEKQGELPPPSVRVGMVRDFIEFIHRTREPRHRADFLLYLSKMDEAMYSILQEDVRTTRWKWLDKCYVVCNELPFLIQNVYTAPERIAGISSKNTRTVFYIPQGYVNEGERARISRNLRKKFKTAIVVPLLTYKRATRT